MARTDELPRFRVAAVQAAPAFLDRERTVDLVETWTDRAAQQGARVVAFPESFVPAFPVWNLVLAPVDQHGLYEQLYRSAVLVPGRHTAALGDTARRCGVFLSVGVTERSATSVGTMWNSNLLFDPAGRLINHRRKIVPTWAEKLTWAWGDASDLRPVDTELGRIGVLICGENTNTLARYALLAQGEQLHISTFPPAWPFRRPGQGENYNLTRAIELRAAAHAFEGKLFNVVSSAVLTDDAIEKVGQVDESAIKVLEAAPPAVSLIVHPNGEVCSETLVGEEGIVTADIDLSDSIAAKEIHDLTGSYQRFDLFRFEVDQRPQLPIRLLSDGGSFTGTERSAPDSHSSRAGSSSGEQAGEPTERGEPHGQAGDAG